MPIESSALNSCQDLMIKKMHTKNGLKEITWRSDLQLMLPSWANSCNGAKSAEAVIASFIGTETAFLSPSCIAFSLRSFSSYKSHSKTTLTWNLK